MAYMCADSGNLMAIAQQVIQQQQQQQQQQQNHHHHHHHHQQQQMATAVNPFSVNPSPWMSHHQHPTLIPEPFPFTMPHDPASAFPDPFVTDTVVGFPSVDGDHHHLDQGTFHISDFGADAEEWMESLIGVSPAESSAGLMSDAWPCFANAFASCSAAISLPSPTSTSDLNSVLFSGPPRIGAAEVVDHHFQLPALHVPNSSQAVAKAVSFDPPLSEKDAVAAAPQDRASGSGASSSLLLKSLCECARIADADPGRAATSIARIRESASEVGDPTERVAFYFVEALCRRLSAAQWKLDSSSSYSVSPLPPCTSSPFESSPEDFTLCYKALNDACPYSKFSHLTANQAILEATESSTRIHIIDFGIVQGVQWAALLQDLATRPAGKPSKVRVSGIPSPGLGASPEDSLAATGNRLRDFAAVLDLDFEFHPVLTPIPELGESTFRIDPSESVAVNFMLQLFHMLEDSLESVERVLRVASTLAPRVVTLGEYEVSLNRGAYADRFGRALAYYAAVFESLDPAMGRDSAERVGVERRIFGHRILKAVGSAEGADRRERMETRDTWRALMERCGFGPVGFSNYAVSQAKLLLWNYNYSSKYSLGEAPPSFLSLAWDDRPLLTVSAWRQK